MTACVGDGVKVCVIVGVIVFVGVNDGVGVGVTLAVIDGVGVGGVGEPHSEHSTNGPSVIVKFISPVASPMTR